MSKYEILDAANALFVGGYIETPEYKRLKRLSSKVAACEPLTEDEQKVVEDALCYWNALCSVR